MGPTGDVAPEQLKGREGTSLVPSRDELSQIWNLPKPQVLYLIVLLIVMSRQET